MEIVVLTGSPRRHGNSSVLADNFIKGAESNGHNVFRFDTAFHNIHPCIACNKCGGNGVCAFNDDFTLVREHIVIANLIAFVSPLYYYGMTAQIKCLIDRFYSVNARIQTPKKSVLMLTYADATIDSAKAPVAHYEAIINYLGWKDAGRIIAPNTWEAGDINKTEYPKLAYELGASL